MNGAPPRRVRPILTRKQAEWIQADADYHGESATAPVSRARWRAIARALRIALDARPKAKPGT